MENASKFKLNLTWEVIEGIVDTLADDIREEHIEYTGILGITRGGVIPAILLAGALGIRDVKTFQLSRYHDGVPGEVLGVASNDKVTLGGKWVNGKWVPGKWLIVDDIVGTGDTLKKVQSIFPGTDMCALLARPGYEGSVRVGRNLTENQGWVVFPWERIRQEDGVQNCVSELQQQS